MAINFKVIERGQPGVAGGGEKKFYASPVMDGELDMADLTKAIEKICTVSGADIRAVLYALVDVSIDNLSNGTIVRMGDLGSFRIGLSSEGKAKAEEVTSSAIKNNSILFTPGTRLKEMMASAKYQKV
ncbi:MAG TPA: DNA-binding protein [Marinilabiliales bacterium]|nr:MAG: DNA-binding protein [Bacteroidetes bacterium GWA2_40_14]OFX59853.1 MAG: DNA-binding protein [Bacteroidetes bacterium GWC2_40_13]OFX71589.1 MAG: DNA-binding protein [Bacteroidetes bacterium GWD2_40_43]OFX95623.1 MAG: DNA-binding protein [Bacteroidetes bacterium GWE2_40_63]OFY22219.1 MAG: DNA-binding protein [Bacteroidetes bacterium GWF2_40_13]OFZ24858.1 MAG: DNA-binding protein [Bacteroidetes bacterium RIFOXYC2_FULL_40_12]HAM98291.1 DNA-binding protein [Marinilabiliales bacterium]